MQNRGSSQFVVGIDIGSTFSGYTFASRDEIQQNPPKFHTAEWYGNRNLKWKCPTAILLQSNADLVAFGYDAQNRFSEIIDDDKHNDYYFFNDFKINPYRQIITDISGKPFDSLKLLSCTIRYFIYLSLHKIHELMKELVDDDDVYFVLTVPAEWDDHGRQIMRVAAKRAGLTDGQIGIISEPVATSLFMQQWISYSGLYPQLAEEIRKGEKYIIIDLGGTVNITCHRNNQNGTIEELVTLTGCPWGGTAIDEAFHVFLCEICGEKIIERLMTEFLDDYISLFYEFQVQKRGIGCKQTSDILITLPRTLVHLVEEKHMQFVDAIEQSNHGENVIFNRQRLCISAETFKSLFYPPIWKLMSHILNIMNDPEVSNISIIMIAGGFSDCELVQYALRERFGHSKFLFIPEEAGTAVMKGAVLFGFPLNVATIRTAENQNIAHPVKDPLMRRLSKMNSKEFEDLISKGDYASYENRVYLAGCCNIGKSSLASILIGDEVPKRWNSTDGLVIHFGRNGIHLEDKKMIPIEKSERNIVTKLLLGEPNLDRLEARKKDKSESNLAKSFPIRPRVSSASTPDHHAFSKIAIEPVDTTPAATESLSHRIGRHSLKFESEQKRSFNIPNISLKTASSIQSDVLNAIRDGTYQIRVAPSDLVDFGGQRSFDMTHQLFIQHKGTFVLMFDGRYGLHSKLKEYKQGNVTAKEILVHWVNSILFYCGDGDDKMPMILFAATHSDQLRPNEIKDGKRKYISELTALFETHNQKKHIIYDRLFFIDATNQRDEEIGILKDALVEIAFQQPTWGQRMPVAWVPLEYQISELRKKDIYLITKDMIQELNKSNVEFMLSEFLLDQFLKLQHSLGKIMYFDQPGLQKFIVVQPTAMVNILRSFVTDEMFWPRELGLRRILKTMVNTGTVNRRQLFELWSQPQFKEMLPSIEQKEYIVQVLVHLDILVEPKHDDKYDPKEETYLVPCLVKSEIPMKFLKFEEQNTICLAYQLTESIIPSALTFKLIGAAVTTWPLKQIEGRNCLFHQSAILCVDEGNELLIHIKGQRVTLFLSNKYSKHFIPPDVAASIQECFTLALERVLLFYHDCFGRLTANLNVLSLFEIEVGEWCNNDVCLLPLPQAEKAQSWRCKNKQKHETRYCLDWVFNRQNDRHIKSCDTKCIDLAKKTLDVEPTDQHLVRIAKQLGINEFYQFFIYLGMTSDEWEDIEHRFMQNDIMCRKLMALYKWRKKTTPRRLHDLLDALHNINRPQCPCQIVRGDSNVCSIAEGRLQLTPSDEVLEELSHRLGNCVIQLGIELGISFNSIEETMYRFPKDMYGQLYDILNKWKCQRNEQPTIHRLIMVLQRVECGGLIFLQDQYK